MSRGEWAEAIGAILFVAGVVIVFVVGIVGGIR